MGRSCVVNAIFFSAFEFTKKRVNRLEVNEELLREHGL
jgi:solute carrier family 25 carnitine/acylcarnitine transporter 20/29